MITPIILAGGSGSRLWPLSRSAHPKQFLKLSSSYTMLQETMLRLDGLDVNLPVTVCNEEHRFFVAEQLRSINQLGPIILEPEGRNTAPAIALAAAIAQEYCEEDPLLLVLPADHVIQNQEAFLCTVRDAVSFAKQGKLVTFGIVPDKAHTGYGYIQQGQNFSVKQFVEKPDIETAKQYVNSGEFFWNSGMFLFKASTYLSELKNYRADIAMACENALANTSKDLDFIRLQQQAFLSCPSDSIDYAVMEKTPYAVVLPLDANWNDIGSWSSLWDVGQKDVHGNVVKADAILEDTNNCFVSGTERLIATIGLDDIIIVDTKDALLVARKDKVQEVKTIVEKLKMQDRLEWLQHREVYRPWGKYDSIDNGDRYQVKRITVNPGAKLSVQMHFHRAEHWVVVSGTAKVTKGSDTFLVSENESTFIPLGAIHALENPGKVPLELIEVQSGAYFGEDDIIRFEDQYGRVKEEKVL